jgi:hypothetical protein
MLRGIMENSVRAPSCVVSCPRLVSKDSGTPTQPQPHHEAKRVERATSHLETGDVVDRAEQALHGNTVELKLN